MLVLLKDTDKVVSKSSEASLNQTNAKGLNIRVVENMYFLKSYYKLIKNDKQIIDARNT